MYFICTVVFCVCVYGFITLIFTDYGAKGRAYSYLCRELDLTEEELENVLHDIFLKYPHLEEHKVSHTFYVETNKRWWASHKQVENIKNIIEKESFAYVYQKASLSNMILQNQNMELQNESLTIDIKQKTNWKCPYCGNVNPSSSFKCLSCNSGRQE